MGSLIATAGLVVTFIANFGSPWDAIGWVTPNSHASDLELIRAEFVTTIESEKTATEEFRTEWRCSRWADDLDELYEELRQYPDSRQIRDRIDSLRERMDENDCDRWEEY